MNDESEENIIDDQPVYGDPDDPHGDFDKSIQVKALLPKTDTERRALIAVMRDGKPGRPTRFKDATERSKLRKLIPIGKTDEGRLKLMWIEQEIERARLSNVDKPHSRSMAWLMVRLGNNAAYLEAAPALMKKLRASTSKEEARKLLED